MKVCNFLKKHSVLAVLILMIVCLTGSTIPMRNLFEKISSYPNAILLEGLVLQGVLALLCYGFIKILGDNEDLGLRFENSIHDLWVTWPFVVYIIMNIAGSISEIPNIHVGFSSVLLYIITFIITGLFEEILVRGAALKVFIHRYGKSKKGLFKAVIVCNIVFGLANLNSYFTGQSDLMTTGVKIINAFSLGVLYCAIFLRTKSLWIPVIIHSLTEICGSVQVLEINSKEALQAMITGNTITLEAAFQVVCMSLPFLIAGLFFLKGVKEGTKD